MAIDTDTGLANDWNPLASSTVIALAISDDTLYVGGSFSQIGGQQRRNIAALHAPSGNAFAWDPKLNSAVYTLAISGNTVYAGGDFSSIGGGQPSSYIAAIPR